MSCSPSFPRFRFSFALHLWLAFTLVLPFSASARVGDGAEADAAGTDRARLAQALASKAAFAAGARPRLLAAGYGSPAERLPSGADGRDYSPSVWEDDGGDPEDWTHDTARLAERLWYFSPFPGVAETLLSGLEQADLPLEQRLDRFLGQSGVLYAFLKEADLADADSWRAWARFWLAGLPEGDGDLSVPTRARRKAALFLTPLLLRLLEEDAPPAHLAAMHARHMPARVPWNSGGRRAAASPAVVAEDTDYAAAARPVLDALAARPDDEALWTRVGDFLASGPGTPAQRLRGAPALRWNTDPVMAATAAALVEMDPATSHADWLTCWDWNTGRGGFTYSLHCAVENNGAALLARWVADRDRVSSGAPSAPLPEGEAARIDRLEAEPDFAALFADRTSGRPYLLFVKEDAVPEAERNRALLHVFADTPFSLGGPLLLPLSPDRAEDRALLEWYAREGADSESCLLLASPAPERRLLRRVQAWHLNLRVPADGGAPDLTLGLPYTASFWFAHLPVLRGRARALCLEPGETLYLKHPSVLGDAWFAFRPGPETGAFPDGEGALLLELPSEAWQPLNARFSADFLDRTARRAAREWPRPGVTPRAALDFMIAGDRELGSLAETDRANGMKAWSLADFRRGLLLLWRLEDSPAREEGHRILFDPATAPGERRNRVEQLLKNAERTPDPAQAPAL